MATIKIYSGPIEPTFPASQYDQSQWRDLVRERKYYIKSEITKDCRYLSLFVQEAKEMFAACGFASAEEMVKKGHDLDPAEMEIVVQWLELNDPDEAIPLRTVLDLAERVAQLAETTPEAQTHGGARLSKKSNNLARGTNAAYLTSVIARDHPKILADMKAGKYRSVRQAAITAGIIKPQKPDLTRALKKLLKHFPKKEILAGLEQIKD